MQVGKGVMYVRTHAPIDTHTGKYITNMHLYINTNNAFTALIHYLAPGRGCEVLFLPGLSVCVFVCVSGQYFGILFLSY